MLGVPAKQGADAAQVNQASPVMTYSNVFDNDMVSWQNNPNLSYILQILSWAQCFAIVPFCGWDSVLFSSILYIYIYMCYYVLCLRIFDLMIFCFTFLKVCPFELIGVI